MAILTKFLQLLKPEKNDYVDVEKHLSENYDKIDTKMEELNNSNDEKLNKGNLVSTIQSGEDIFKALQGNTGIKFDEDLLYLNDEGTKKTGFCYLDRLADGIFECIQETTTTVNDATYFKNFSNKENSDRLSKLITVEEIELTEYTTNSSSSNGKFFKYYTNTNNIIAVIPFNIDGFFEMISIGTDVNLNDGLEVSFQGMSTKIKIRIIRLNYN